MSSRTTRLLWNRVRCLTDAEIVVPSASGVPSAGEWAYSVDDGFSRALPDGRALAVARGQQHAVARRVAGHDALVHPLRVGARVRQPVGRAVALRLVRQHEFVAIEPERALGWRRCTLALPGVEPDVVVVPARRQEQRAGIGAHHHVEAEHAVVEAL